MDPLASEEDVAKMLGKSELSEAEHLRVEPILQKASELFRIEAARQFADGVSHRRLKVNGGRVRLPEHPVIEVLEVATDDGHPVDYSLFGHWLTVGLGSHEFVRVSWEHDGAVPDLVRLTIADVTAKVLRIEPDAQAGIRQASHTEGPYTEQVTYAAWALGGTASLAPEDIEIARRYRYSGGQLIVQQP